jgi:hypothetical protein
MSAVEKAVRLDDEGQHCEAMTLLFDEISRLQHEIERLQVKIDHAVEVYGQEFANPYERARQMWFALRGERVGG